MELPCTHWVRAMALRRVLVKMIPRASGLLVNSFRISVLSVDRLLFSNSGIFTSCSSSALFSEDVEGMNQDGGYSR